jgi:hypothetical protein
MESLNRYMTDGTAQTRLHDLRGRLHVFPLSREEHATVDRITAEAQHGLLGAEALAALEQIGQRQADQLVAARKARVAAQAAPPVPSSPVAVRTPSTPSTPAAPSWPDATEIYAARRRDVERAGRTGRALMAVLPEEKPAPSPSAPEAASGPLGLDAAAIYAARKAAVAAAGGRRS